MSGHSLAPVKTWNGSEWVRTTESLLDGLVGHWPLDSPNTMSGTALDISRGGAHGTIETGVTTGVSSPTGGGYNYSGSGGGVSHDPITLADQEPRTVSVWTRTQSSHSDYLLPFGERGNSNSTIYWSTGNGTSAPIFRYRSVGDNTVLLDSHNFFDGSWHNVVWRVGSDRVVDVFDNGGRVGGGTVTGTGFTYDNIGRGYNNVDYMHFGDLADMRIYDRELTDGEIALLYESA